LNSLITASSPHPKCKGDATLAINIKLIIEQYLITQTTQRLLSLAVKMNDALLDSDLR
jgi:hypothetical protein